MTTPTLEVGTVLVEHYGFDGMALDTVVRLTPTQAITARGRKYRLSDGRKIGDYGHATIATEAHRQELAHRKLMREVYDMLPDRDGLKRLTTAQLTSLLALLQSFTPPAAGLGE